MRRAAFSIAPTWPPSARSSMATNTSAMAKKTTSTPAIRGLDEKKPPVSVGPKRVNRSGVGPGRSVVPARNFWPPTPTSPEWPLAGTFTPSSLSVAEIGPPAPTSAASRPVRWRTSAR